MTCSPHLVVVHLAAVKDTVEMIEKSRWAKTGRQLSFPIVDGNLGGVHHAHCGRHLQRRGQHGGRLGRRRLLLLERLLCSVCGHKTRLFLGSGTGCHGVVGSRGLHSR